MTTIDAKQYLSQRDIPQLFECLMTGLMYNRPKDHIDYLLDCLKKVKKIGIDQLRWNIFIEHQRKSAKQRLPPISSTTPDNGIRRDASFVSEHSNINKSSPLPPILNKIPECPLVFVMGGPGSGKATQAKMLTNRYDGWVHLSMGDLLRSSIFKHGSVDQKWNAIQNIVKQGDLAPEELTIELILEELAKNMNAKGIILEGYPRTMEQAKEYEKHIGHVDLVFLLDCEEYYLKQRLGERLEKEGRFDDNKLAAENKLNSFKKNTLPLLKYFDDQEKLVVIEGDRDADEIFYDLSMLFDSTFYGKVQPQINTKNSSDEFDKNVDDNENRLSTPASKISERPESAFPEPFDLPNVDLGRKSNMPTGKIIIVCGGPESYRKKFCEKYVENHSNVCLLSMIDLINTNNSDEFEEVKKGDLLSDEVILDILLNGLLSVKDSQSILIEGFPRNREQLENLIEHIGGINTAILIDCEETEMKKRLDKKFENIEDRHTIIANKIRTFKHNTLPVLSYFDDKKKLIVIEGDRKFSQVYLDFENELEEQFKEKDNEQIIPTTNNNGETNNNESKENIFTDKESIEVKEEVIEKVDDIKTGLNDGNPNYISELDSSADNDLTKKQQKEASVYFILGGPGSGKGTQCDKIVEKYGFVHLSSGDLLRDEVKSGSERGKELNAIMERGELVSIDIVLQLIKEAIEKATNPKGFLIDGYPRELEQGLRFEKEIQPVTKVVYFNVSDEIMTQRLLKRGETSGRVDDNEETIKKRLNTFHDLTQPTIDHYATQNKTIEIPADGTVDEIFAQVSKVFQDYVYVFL